MKKEPMSPEKMSDVVAGLTGEEKGGKFRELIEKNDGSREDRGVCPSSAPRSRNAIPS